jgi:hypothetical protein
MTSATKPDPIDSQRRHCGGRRGEPGRTVPLGIRLAVEHTVDAGRQAECRLGLLLEAQRHALYRAITVAVAFIRQCPVRRRVAEVEVSFPSFEM